MSYSEPDLRPAAESGWWAPARLGILDVDQLRAATPRHATVRARSLQDLEDAARRAAESMGYDLVREGNPPTSGGGAFQDPREGNTLLFEGNVRLDTRASHRAILRAYSPHVGVAAALFALAAVNLVDIRSSLVYLGVGIGLIAVFTLSLTSTPPLQFRSELLVVRFKKAPSAPAAELVDGAFGFDLDAAAERAVSENRLMRVYNSSKGRPVARIVTTQSADADSDAVEVGVIASVSRPTIRAPPSPARES